MKDPGGRKKIVPAVAAMAERADAALRARSLRGLLDAGAATFGKLRRGLAEVAIELKLTSLTQEERELLTGAASEGQDLVAQRIGLALAESPEVQRGAGVKPEEADAMRLGLEELGRAQEAGFALQRGTAHGRRLAAALLAYALVRLSQQIERGLDSGSPEERAELLSETATLRARVRALVEAQAGTRQTGQAEAGRLAEAATAAEADLQAAQTLEALRTGARPADADLLQAAEHLRPAPPPAPSTNRRRGGR